MSEYRDVTVELSFMQVIRVQVGGVEELTREQREMLDATVQREINRSGDPPPSKIDSDPWTGGHGECGGMLTLGSKVADGEGDPDLVYTLNEDGKFEFEKQS